jgi:hypothetical protein
VAGLNQFKFVPKDLMEWSRWMRDQDLEPGLGNPSSGSDRTLVSDSDGNREWKRQYDQWPGQWRGSSNQSLGTSAITVDLAVEDINPDAHYALDSDQVIVEDSTMFKLTYTVFASVDSTAGITQCNLLAFLRKDGTAIDGSYSAAYIHETGTPDVSCEGSVIVSLSAGNSIDIRAQLSAATDVSTVAARCKLLIERVR